MFTNQPPATPSRNAQAAISAKFPGIFRTFPSHLCEAVDMTRDARSPGPCSAEVPALPAWKAFVVQFSRESGPETAVLAGRIEHLSSGRRAHFHSAGELVAALQRLLAELGEGAKP